MTKAPRAAGRSGKRGKAVSREYPVATIALYGPNDTFASKAAVGIVKAEGAQADPLKRWYSEEIDIRSNQAIIREMVNFISRNHAKSVVITDGIIGCPHEEGIDYPEGEPCPCCPFWEGRDRWTGEVIE